MYLKIITQTIKGYITKILKNKIINKKKNFVWYKINGEIFYIRLMIVKVITDIYNPKIKVDI